MNRARKESKPQISQMSADEFDCHNRVPICEHLRRLRFIFPRSRPSYANQNANTLYIDFGVPRKESQPQISQMSADEFDCDNRVPICEHLRHLRFIFPQSTPC
jgi:hypothetical protein